MKRFWLLMILLPSICLWISATHIGLGEHGEPLFEPRPQIVPSRYAQFVFPLSGDPASTWWEPRHWDGTNAVDIRLNPSFGPGSPERTEFAARAVVAVTSGTAHRRDNARGGISVVLHGVDGQTYYYAHLASTNIEDFRLVDRGEVFGIVGNTGAWTRYLEPHLHFSIARGHLPGLDWVADVDAVAWMKINFELTSARLQIGTYQGDYPTGTPIFGNYRVVQSFSDAISDNPNLAGVTIESASTSRIPIRAPLTGEVRIHSETIVGTRIQITNRVSNQSVIISGSLAPFVGHGEVVHAEMIVGSGIGRIHYMHFDEGIPKDPMLR